MFVYNGKLQFLSVKHFIFIEKKREFLTILVIYMTLFVSVDCMSLQCFHSFSSRIFKTY